MAYNYIPQLTENEFYYNVTEVRDLLNLVLSMDVTNDQRRWDQWNALKQAQDIICDLVRVVDPNIWDRIENQFGKFLTFTQEVNYVVVSAKRYNFTRLQAVLMTQRLTQAGLVNFVVKYQGGGQIEWSPPKEDIYFQLLQEYPENKWTLWKDQPADNYTYRLKLKPSQGTLDAPAAESIADKIKERWPSIRIVVYYNSPEEGARVVR